MKKSLAKILLIFIVIINLLPFSALAKGGSTPLEQPYEKVVAKSGHWYAEQLAYGGKTNLVVGYNGSWKTGEAVVIEMSIKEDIVLTGVYIPVVGATEGDISLVIEDIKGNIYSDFLLEKQKSAGLVESVYPNTESSTLKTLNNNMVCIFIPISGMTLSEGGYTLRVEGANGLSGEFLVKGIHANSYEKYRQALLKWELENNLEQSPEENEKVIGNKALSEENASEYEYGMGVESNPPIFALDSEYQIDEIIVSTYNNGQGALPGMISIISENGQTLYSGQSYGMSIENIANAGWKIAPNILLQAGNYMISLSQPEVVSYDQDGEPLFYVKASIPVQIRPDFTGTYNINLDAYKTSTLMGAVSEQGSSFSLQDFELTVLDKDGEIELIGQYERIPFSQRCEIVEETTKNIVAKFDLAADLTKLPYKANISANALVTLTVVQEGILRIDIEGIGIFDRNATAQKGADHNTYDIKATGNMTQRELPPFVMTALGRSGGAGNIPGPDNSTQAAAGILFPPLVGLIVSVLQDALKPKSVVRDKNWYKKKYPGKTDEQLAMIMLADAMGNTDNPDEGDVVSVGDNENMVSGSTSSGDGLLSGDYEHEAENEYWSGDDYENEAEPIWEPEKEYESDNGTVATESTEEQTLQTTEQLGQEPETMVLKTSTKGAETLYVKDPATGEWIDPQTNSVLDLEKYPEAMEQMQKNEEWSIAREQEIQNKGGSEHDKELHKNMEAIKQKEKEEAYKNTLSKKYGIDDMDEIKKIVDERKIKDEEWAAIWHRNDKVLGAMEWGAVATGAAADVGIDGLALVTPGGSQIKAGYKVLKGVAGTMAEAGAKGKDAFTLANIAEGAIKGGADAALDKIPGGNGFVGKGLSNLSKGALSIAGEGAGSGVGAALRGEDAADAMWKGMEAGAYKAAAGFVTDQIGGDMPNPIVSRGSFKAVPNLKNVIVSRAGGTKIGSALVDEYGVKPIVMGN